VAKILVQFANSKLMVPCSTHSNTLWLIKALLLLPTMLCVRYSSVSRSPILGRNKKVEEHIRKKTRKPNALRFWVEVGVIPLYVLAQFSFLEISPVFLPWILPTSGIRAVGLRLGRVQFDPVSKVFLMVISGKRVPYKCVNSGTSEGS